MMSATRHKNFGTNQAQNKPPTSKDMEEAYMFFLAEGLFTYFLRWGEPKMSSNSPTSSATPSNSFECHLLGCV